MATHMSLRLAWHDSGWNGHICNRPCENGYCIGIHSYPGDVIRTSRDLDYDEAHKGEAGSTLKCPPACGFSYNAFGSTAVTASAVPPEWMGDGAKTVDITIPPYTACTWCYEKMFCDEAKNKGSSSQVYDNNKRFEYAREYFDRFEPGKSLVFYYAGYSNPFSDAEEKKYVVVGLSRIQSLGSYHYYGDVSDKIRENYANGIIWQKPVTSNYPEEGLRIPYEKYMAKDEIISRILFVPESTSNFKYGSREITDDDAINIVLRFIQIVDVLIEIGDDSENWEYRRKWLNGLLGELWAARGPYPGMPAVLGILGLEPVISEYIALSKTEDMKQYYTQMRELLERNGDKIGTVCFTERERRNIQRTYNLMEDGERRLLCEIFPRMDIKREQMSHILSGELSDVSITATVDEIADNPYILFEQYVGYDTDDVIPFYKIDNGVLSSPEYGLDNIGDFNAGSAERLRALCVDEMRKIAAHSFGKAESVLENVNKRLKRMTDWMSHVFKMRNFKVDYEILKEALFMREDEHGNLYLYLNDIYEDERTVEAIFRRLVEERPDIPLKRPISLFHFEKELMDRKSGLMTVMKDSYERIIGSQAEICMRIFNKPLCVLSGAAGTGKTTVIGAILKNIRRVHGVSTEVLIMAPTGKATERIKQQTGEKSMTIHSFLAQNGWINKNFTMKRSNGKVRSDINTIIIDECSMIDLNIFATLVRAINWDSVQRLILVGDPNQLPPIGRGRVFADTIDWLESGYPDYIGTLTQNIRQLVNTIHKKGTGILSLANIFIQENQFDNSKLKAEKEKLFNRLDEKVDEDLSVYYWKDIDELDTVLHEKLMEYMEEETGESRDHVGVEKLWSISLKDENGVARPEHIQVISPYRGEYYGTDELNRYLQKTLNWRWSKQYFIDNIGLCDKVIQFRNRPQSDPAYAYNLDKKVTEQQEIFNGEIGIVRLHGFDTKDFYTKNKEGKRKLQHIKRFQVLFSGASRSRFWYNYGKGLGKNSAGQWIKDQDPIENLELAYAISVHKSQGSEFDVVFIVIPDRDSHLLSMELLYTAITRAQKKVILLIQNDVGTLVKLGRVEKSAVRRINSSVFEFRPLPEEFLYFNSWYKEGRRLATLTKYLVRSKSEVIIANLLFEEDVPFEYEVPLYAPDGTVYLPDFTVMFQGETYYWEHLGMLDYPQYKAHWKKKQDWYGKHFPGKLIVTSESDKLTKNVMNIINKYRGVRRQM